MEMLKSFYVAVAGFSRSEIVLHKTIESYPYPLYIRSFTNEGLKKFYSNYTLSIAGLNALKKGYQLFNNNKWYREKPLLCRSEDTKDFAIVGHLVVFELDEKAILSDCCSLHNKEECLNVECYSMEIKTLIEELFNFYESHVNPKPTKELIFHVESEKSDSLFVKTQ
jgi:hypothetical protein